MKIMDSKLANELPLTHRLRLEFLDKFRAKLNRKEQQMLFAMVYFGFSAIKFNAWMQEPDVNYGFAQRAEKNKEFASIHAKFMAHLEEEGLTPA